MLTLHPATLEGARHGARPVCWDKDTQCTGMLLLTSCWGAEKAHPQDALTLLLVIHNSNKSEMLPSEPEFCLAFKPTQPQRKRETESQAGLV